MLIYSIKNKINGKRYIGQTIFKSFNYRYSGGRWWDITNNQMLKNAYKKYGKDKFEIQILEKNVESIEKLNELEIFYAEKFNSYKPNGYNLKECGKNGKLLDWQKREIGKRASKTYTLRKIDTWELVTFTNLSKFCRENGFKRSGMQNMLCKLDGVLQCNGYCLPETTKKQIRDRNKRNTKGRVFKLLDENGILFEFDDIKIFAENHGLGEGCLRKVLNGKCLYVKGFRLPERYEEKATRWREFSFISPNGEIFNGNNISKFARNKNLSPQQMNSVLRGKISHHKGWARNPNFKKESP